jgi:hypothetical protein
MNPSQEKVMISFRYDFIHLIEIYLLGVLLQVLASQSRRQRRIVQKVEYLVSVVCFLQIFPDIVDGNVDQKQSQKLLCLDALFLSIE